MEHFKETQYGFEWGSLRVERLIGDDDLGFVVMVGSLTGKDKFKNSIQVRVSPKGRKVNAYKGNEKIA